MRLKSKIHEKGATLMREKKPTAARKLTKLDAVDGRKGTRKDDSVDNVGYSKKCR